MDTAFCDGAVGGDGGLQNVNLRVKHRLTLVWDNALHENKKADRPHESETRPR